MAPAAPTGVNDPVFKKALAADKASSGEICRAEATVAASNSERVKIFLIEINRRADDSPVGT